MPSFTSAIVAIAAVLSVASGSPLVARDVCGAAPTGSNQQTPLKEPTGISTAADCMTQCKANTDCQSFMFGLVNNVNACQLFSVPAAELPPSTNLVAYDSGCSDVPSVTLTTANPTGINQNQGQTQGGKPQKRQNVVTGATHAAPMNGIPQAGQAPLATPSNIGSVDACLAACQGNPSCISYTFIFNVCNLFAYILDCLG